MVLGIDIDENSMETLEQGGIPKLKALQLHNSTVYRWNRPCYGVLDGTPTLRIENRALPAGPTIADEVANATFWFGLVSGMVQSVGDIKSVLSFDVAKSNFLAAARQGLDAQFEWMGGGILPATELIREQLLPMAREGLEEAEVDRDDVDRFLGIVEARVRGRRTGSAWRLGSYERMKGHVKTAEAMTALVTATIDRQKDGKPVHEWELAGLEDTGDWRHSFRRVEQYMTTEVFTVHEDEVIDLVANVMDWKHVRHVPVENDAGELVGIVSYRQLLRLLARDLPRGKESPVPAKEIMKREVVTVVPETTTLEAIDLMRKHKVACLPVVMDRRLVGLVSERDFLKVAGGMLLEQLRREEEAGQ